MQMRCETSYVSHFRNVTPHLRDPQRTGNKRPELGDRKRQIASIYVWVQVTSGEHYFAPRPIEAAQSPEVQEAWKERRNTIWHLMHRSQPGPRYTSLKAELGIIADSLARTAGAHEPDHGSWRPMRVPRRPSAVT